MQSLGLPLQCSLSWNFQSHSSHSGILKIHPPIPQTNMTAAFCLTSICQHLMDWGIPQGKSPQWFLLSRIKSTAISACFPLLSCALKQHFKNILSRIYICYWWKCYSDTSCSVITESQNSQNVFEKRRMIDQWPWQWGILCPGKQWGQEGGLRWVSLCWLSTCPSPSSSAELPSPNPLRAENPNKTLQNLLVPRGEEGAPRGRE